MIIRKDFDGQKIDLRSARRDAVVTDQALLDYVRVMYGIDVEQLRRDLLSPAVLQAMVMGADAVRGDGFKLVIKGRRVVRACASTHLGAAVEPVEPAR